MSGDHSASRALVTGGSQGIGRAIAKALLAQGCRQLVIAGRDEPKGQAAAAELSAEGAKVHFHVADMADAGAAIGMVDAAAERMGRVDVLVNAAGDSGRGGILDATPKVWDNAMAVNAKGPFFAIQRVAERAISDGHPASIVNVLSMSLHCGQSFLGPYSASKAALANITRNAANALRSHRIRVNAVAPGWMNTEGEDAVQKKWHGAGDDWLEKSAAAQPFGQLVEPDELARLVAYMAGPGAGVMTGAVVDYDQTIAGALPE